MCSLGPATSRALLKCCLPEKGFFRAFRRAPKVKRNGLEKPVETNLNGEVGNGLLHVPLVERRIVDLWKPFLFTIGVTGGCFAGAAIWRYERLQKLFQERKNFFTFDPTYGWNVNKTVDFRQRANDIWNQISEGQKAIGLIIALNTFVYLMWKTKFAYPLLVKYFLCNPYSKTVCSPLVLSTFSHSGIFHLGINMYVLNSFGPRLIDYIMGMEEFWAFYLSAGCWSSMAGLAYKCLVKQRVFSLGASGAVLAALSYVCAKDPDSRLQIIFLPWFSFSADTGLKGCIAFELCGLLFRWRMFDHAAHLGGLLFGIAYAKYGEGLWKKYNGRITEWWSSVNSR